MITLIQFFNIINTVYKLQLRVKIWYNQISVIFLIYIDSISNDNKNINDINFMTMEFVSFIDNHYSDLFVE